MDNQSTTHACIVCQGTNWLPLPSPHASRSVRSDGAILNQPLLKAQCEGCGLIQSNQVPDTDSLATLYTEAYDIYNNRPASEQFVTNRYTALANAITQSIAPYQPKKVLEVGCGNGATLQAVQAVWKDAECIGVEPVLTAVLSAQQSGFNVHQGMIGVDVPDDIAKQQFDVIYSVHVIEHTQDPVAFLKELKKMLAPKGHLIISCPNACIPNLEIMRTDHHYSMTPYHLEMLAVKAGFQPVKNGPCPGGAENLDYEHNQLLVCVHAEEVINLTFPDYLNENNRTRLYEARKKYFEDFGKLDVILQSQITGVNRLFCFGTGGWACVLAGYAPNVWSKIEACVIDGGAEGLFHGKPIHAYDTLKNMKPDAVLVGTNPATQPIIIARLNQDGFKPIPWNNIIPV